MPQPKRTRAERKKAINDAWWEIDEANPGISTERLIAMIADWTGEDYGDVAILMGDDDAPSK